MSYPDPDAPALHHNHRNFHNHGRISHYALNQIAQQRDMPIAARAPTLTITSDDPSTTYSVNDYPTVSCGPNDRSGPCERMVAASPNMTTIPVVLGVVIPLTVAFVVLVFLHRRHVKKLRREDTEDRTKSLDFGMDGPVTTEKKKKRLHGRSKGLGGVPEMTTADDHGSGKRDRGMSLDLTIANPYILPPELQGSRESLHSLSRSINTGDDKYRATNFIPDDGSLRSPSSLRHRDDASIYTYSSRQRAETDSTRGLLPHGHAPPPDHIPTIRKPMPIAKETQNTSLLAPVAPDVSRESYVSNDSRNGELVAMRASNNYLGQYISGGAKKQIHQANEVQTATAKVDGNSSHGEPQLLPPTVPKASESERNSQVPVNDGFDFGIPPNTFELPCDSDAALQQTDNLSLRSVNNKVHAVSGNEPESQGQTSSNPNPPPSATDQKYQQPDPSHEGNMPEINVVADYEDDSDYYDEVDGDRYDINAYKEALGYDPRRLTMGMRPLPPDDPSENPEQRALRIRSFYKEYFDETTKAGGEKARLSYFDGSENYIDDYYGTNNQQEYAYGSYDYNPHASHGPQGHSSYGYGAHGYGSRGPSMASARGLPGQHRATISNGSYMHGGSGPRAYSSASQRMHGQKARQPSKPRPPPQPLAMLPTPAMLKDDSMLPNPMDYAPPQVFKNQRAGTPDSLKGGMKTYSPGARAYNPLVSSFDDLSVLPSPHQFRRSGTFSTLDFAPPRFATASTAGSETGSIRSNQSGMSAKQLHHIRAGAYRLSRIPKEVAGTKEELANALKPQWNAR